MSLKLVNNILTHYEGLWNIIDEFDKYKTFGLLF